jgi:tRNA(Ile)-lysidine synthase
MTIESSLRPSGELVDRLGSDLDAVAAPGTKLGIAVSGGPVSLALLLLAAAARSGLIEAATVDHQLRPGSRSEADMVAGVCAQLAVPHAILSAEWKHKPATAIQERARALRYRLLGGWAKARGLGAIVTAHHLEDQAETMLMRLARGSGINGLAAMRPTTRVPGSQLPLLRPLLGWHRSELEAVCAAADLTPAADPSNDDERFERVRVRRALAEADWLNADALARSAANLGVADAALHWATTQVWAREVVRSDREILFRPAGLPSGIRRRIVRRAVLKLAREGGGADLRGGELDRLLTVLRSGGQATLRGVLCIGGEAWRFVPAPNRTRPIDKPR